MLAVHVSFCSKLVDLLVCVMDFGSSSLGWRPNLGHCDMFLSKTLLSHTTSTYLGVKTSGTALM